MSRTTSSLGGPESRLRVVFMGTPDYGVPTLRGLIASRDVVAVYTQPDRGSGRGRRLRSSPVKQVALDHGIPVFQPASLRKDPEAVADLRAFDADAIVVAAYGLILPPDALQAARLGAINVHASLLPRWRGAAPVSHAILAGDTATGVTIMQMDPGLDTGPVLAAQEVEIGIDETAGELTTRLAEVGAALLLNVLTDVAVGRIVPRPQDEARATPAPRLKPDYGRLDWRDDAEHLRLRVLAMNPWPGAFADLPDGDRLKVHRASVVAPALGAPSPEPPGVCRAVGGSPAVSTGDGWLLLDEVQAPGRRAMPGADFLRGRAALIGARLPVSTAEVPA